MLQCSVLERSGSGSNNGEKVQSIRWKMPTNGQRHTITATLTAVHTPTNTTTHLHTRALTHTRSTVRETPLPLLHTVAMDPHGVHAPGQLPDFSKMHHMQSKR